MFLEDAQDALFHNKVALELPVILLDRGDCTFVTKVRNVEKVGANVALIGDSKMEDSNIFIMSDDGSGHSINIPSFLLRQETADAFKKSYSAGDRIIIKVLIETEKSHGTADVDLWFSTPFDLTPKQLEGLQEFLPYFVGRINFNISIRTKMCLFCQPDEREADCLSNGLYCPLRPSSKDERMSDVIAFVDTIEGRYLMRQSLLAKCVH